MADSRYGTARWRNLRARAIRRDGGQCAIPGCTSDMGLPRMTHVDHVIEIRDGGAFWDLANLQTVCRVHHYAKTIVKGGERVSGGGDRPPHGRICWNYSDGDGWSPASPHGNYCVVPGPKCVHFGRPPEWYLRKARK